MPYLRFRQARSGRRVYVRRREDQGRGLLAGVKRMKRERDPMSDKQKSSETPQASRKGLDQQNQKMSGLDEAAPGTPGTGENIDPKTGEKFIEGIGGA